MEKDYGIYLYVNYYWDCIYCKAEQNVDVDKKYEGEGSISVFESHLKHIELLFERESDEYNPHIETHLDEREATSLLKELEKVIKE